jgi:hypothetical protein
LQRSDPQQREDAVPNHKLGLRLSSAPQINEYAFVRQETKLEQLQRWLTPHPKHQNMMALCGLKE